MESAEPEESRAVLMVCLPQMPLAVLDSSLGAQNFGDRGWLCWAYARTAVRPAVLAGLHVAEVLD